MDITTIDFNYFDAIVGATIFILAIKGFLNGLIKELFGILGLIGGIYVASRMSDTAAQLINDNLFQVENQAILKLIGFVAILAVIWLAAIGLGELFSKLSNASGLGFFNRLLGFIVGGGKYFLIFALIITALSNITLIKDNMGKVVQGSVLYPHLKKAGSIIINLQPKDFKVDEVNTTIAPTPSLDTVIKSGEVEPSQNY